MVSPPSSSSRKSPRTLEVGSLHFSVTTSFTNRPLPRRRDTQVRSSGTNHSSSSPSLSTPFVIPVERHTLNAVQPPCVVKTSRNKEEVGLPFFPSHPGTVTVSVFHTINVDPRGRVHKRLEGGWPRESISTSPTWPPGRVRPQTRSRDTYVWDRNPVHSPRPEGTTVPISSITTPKVPRFLVPRSTHELRLETQLDLHIPQSSLEKTGSNDSRYHLQT